jgi:hypothetical protein
MIQLVLCPPSAQARSLVSLVRESQRLLQVFANPFCQFCGQPVQDRVASPAQVCTKNCTNQYIAVCTGTYQYIIFMSFTYLYIIFMSLSSMYLYIPVLTGTYRYIQVHAS